MGHVDCPKSTSERDPNLVFGVTKMTLSNVEAPGVRGSPKLCGEEEERDGGDGESLPDTPPNEAAIVHQDSKVKNDNKTVHPFSLDIKVDGMAVGLLILGLITRIVRLDTPKHVVFDEMHYGKYASLYLKNTFFFDSNPPLGKMLIALAGYWAGFDGKFSFDKIGQEYSENVPLWHLRFLPALAGSLITPTVYLLVTELGLSPYAGALAGLMVVFDTAILAQSRFILMESMMIFLGLSSLLCVLKFRKISHQPFTPAWFTWLSLSGLLSACAFCVKYIGIYTGFLVTFLLVQDFWRLLPNKALTDRQLLADFSTRVAVLTILPSLLYLSLFSLHFSLLTKAGTHDALMTSQFQASLEGGLGSIIRGQPGVIAHGSQVTLRHTHGKTCWLHSHEHVYPVRYSEGRQQLVDHQEAQQGGPGCGGTHRQDQARRHHPAGARTHTPRPQLSRRRRPGVASQPGDLLLHRLQHLHGRPEPLEGGHHQQGECRGHLAHHQLPGEAGPRQHLRRPEVHGEAVPRLGLRPARGRLGQEHQPGGHRVERGGAPLHQERQGQGHHREGDDDPRAHTSGGDRAHVLGQILRAPVQDVDHQPGKCSEPQLCQRPHRMAFPHPRYRLLHSQGLQQPGPPDREHRDLVHGLRLSPPL